MKGICLYLFLLTLTVPALAEVPMVRLTRFQGQDISGVTASGGFKVELYQADETEAIVEIPAELENNLEFHLGSDGSVTLGIKGKFTGKKKLPDCTAKIYVKDLRKVKVSGASTVNFATPFTSTSVVVETTGASSIKNLNISSRDRIVFDLKGASNVIGVVNTRLLRADLSGSSKLTLASEDETSVWDLSGTSQVNASGNSGDCKISATGASGFHGAVYNIHTANLRSVSASNIEIGMAQELSAHASSAGKIRYKGSPHIKELKTSSAGSVQKN